MSILRSSIFFLVLSTFFLISCSKDKNEPDNAATRAQLINKSWITTSLLVKHNGKDYSLNGSTAEQAGASMGAGKFVFNENGEFISSDEDGQETKGKWELNDSNLKVTNDGESILFTISSINEKSLVLDMAKNLDLSKDDSKWTEQEMVAYLLGSMVLMKNPSVDLSKGTMDVSLGLTAK